MTKCQRSIDKMGDAGKKVGKVVLAAVCSLVYGGIKNGIEAAQGYGRDDSGTIKDSPRPFGDEPPAAREETPTAEAEEKEEEKEEAEEKEEEKEEARDITNQQATTARKAAYQAAINAGVTPAQAQAAADAQTPIGNYAGNYAALSGAGANARAAYRERQGYADALDRETKNLEESRTKAIIAAGLTGGGAGAQTGLSLFGN